MLKNQHSTTLLPKDHRKKLQSERNSKPLERISINSQQLRFYVSFSFIFQNITATVRKDVEIKSVFWRRFAGSVFGKFKSLVTHTIGQSRQAGGHLGFVRICYVCGREKLENRDRHVPRNASPTPKSWTLDMSVIFFINHQTYKRWNFGQGMNYCGYAFMSCLETSAYNNHEFELIS